MSNDRASRTALVLALGLGLVHMPGVLPAPLYPVYQQTVGISDAMVGVLFGTYVGGVMIGLLVMPWIARHRYVLVASCVLSIFGNVLFLVADSGDDLLAAHFVHGLVLGVFTGVVPVVLADFDVSRMSKLVGRATTSGNAIGLAVGPVWSGLLLQYAPLPGRLVWIIQIVLTAAILPLVRLPAGTRSRAELAGSAVPLRTTLRSLLLGAAAYASFLAGFCTFATGGLLGSVGSVAIHSLIGVENGFVTGIIVSLCFGASAVTGAIRARGSDMAVVRKGALWMAVGSLLMFGAIVWASVILMVVATLVIGCGQGLAMQGATQAVALRHGPASTGAAISVFFILCYLGTTLASLGVGSVIAVTSLAVTFNGFAILMVLLCGLAMVLSRTAVRPTTRSAVAGG
ncbi:MFS transporter [Longimycelium tulufanense]|uniref:MFS transporter n=1 Tax=Longimycelium tulufanense TaxID=907463 RepID=UPI00166D2BD4|nr:MFS transporter [Longimycelium tulufanense]